MAAVLAAVMAVTMTAVSAGPAWAADSKKAAKSSELAKMDIGASTSSTAAVSTYQTNLKEPEVSAEGAIVFCPETGEVLYGKNIDEKLDPLSTTKVMTVYLVMKQIEKGKLI